MRCLFLSQDRFDALHTIKDLTKRQRAPDEKARARQKHLARYLAPYLRIVQKIPYGVSMDKIIACSDADWIGDERIRRSTFCGVIRLGNVEKSVGQGTIIGD